MRIILDKIIWGMLLVFLAPTVMIIGSWNALPGDSMYGIKLALERTAVTLASPSYATAGNLQIKYTERRYAEAKQLLSSKQSVAGLPYLQQQIAQTKKSIERAPNKTSQVALAKQYINALTTVSTDLEAQKQSITTGSQPIGYVPPRSSITVPPPASLPQPTATSTLKPTVTPTPRPTAQQTRAISPPGTPTPAPTPTPTPIQIAQVTTTTPITTQQAVVALQIDQTQQNVSQTISDLQTLVDEDDHSRDDRRGRSDDRGRNENNSQKKNDGGDNKR